ncbi:MAG: nitrogen fixation protein NifX [Polyangiales bacterium]
MPTTMRRLGLVPDRAPGEGARLRVALASAGGRALDAHFGSAKKFVVYDVAADHSRFVEVIDFGDASDESGEHAAAADDRIHAKIAALKGCQLLLVLAIGGPVAAKVVKAGIHPIKIATSEPIAVVLEKLSAMIAGDNQPPWMRKLLAPNTERTLSFLDLEDEP